MTPRVIGVLTFVVVAVGVTVGVYFASQVSDGTTAAHEQGEKPTLTPVAVVVGEPSLEQDEPAVVPTAAPPVSPSSEPPVTALPSSPTPPPPPPPPTATPTPEPGVCPPPYRKASTVGDVVGRWQLEGGTVHRDGYVSLHLPAGRHFVVDSGWYSEGLQITIYDLEAQSALNVRSDGCENSRTVPDAAADAVFDEIMATLEIADSYACPSPGRVTPEDFPGTDKAPAVSQIGGQPAKGGAPLRVGDLTLQLPAGRQFRVGGGVSSPGGSFLWLYDVEAQSYLYLRPDGCETSRFIRDAAVDPVFDQIAATVQVTWR